MAYSPGRRHIGFTHNDADGQRVDSQGGGVSTLDHDQFSASQHFVQFYESDDFLVDSVSEFISAGLSKDCACIIIATPAHRQALEQCMHDGGIDLSAAQAHRRYFALDSAELLSKFLKEGTLDSRRFMDVLRRLLKLVDHNQQPLYIFGEMVALLWTEGKREAALELENLWNRLRDTAPPFLLFCAYGPRGLRGEREEEQMAAICECHSHVLPHEWSNVRVSSHEQVLMLTLIQQQTLLLQAEIAQRKMAEERYRHLFESATEGIVLVNAQTCAIIDANTVVSDWLDYTREQLLQQDLSQIGLVAWGQNLEMEVQIIKQHDFVWRRDVILHTRTGQSRHVECFGTLLPTETPSIILYHLNDITMRKQIEAVRSSSEERFRVLINQASFMVWLADEVGACTYVNQAWCSFTGCFEAESRGAGWTKPIHPEDRERAFTLWIQSIDVSQPYHCHVRLQRADGIYLPAQISATPWVDHEGNLAGYIGLINM